MMYTEDDIRSLLAASSDDEILASNTKTSLSEMYQSIFGSICYPSSWRKQDILRTLREYFANVTRTEDLIRRYSL